MKLKQLKRQHEDYSCDALQRNRDLFNGGRDFHKRISSYLPKHDIEPAAVYKRRCESAHYLNYCGPIGNTFASWLFTSALTYKSEPEAVDEFYEVFKEDCDGKGTDLEHFMRHRFVDAMINKKAFWRVEFPTDPPDGAEPETLAEWAEQGMGRAVLVNMPVETIENWRKDKDGYVWLVEHTKTEELIDFADADITITETWTEWNRSGEHRRWQVVYTKNTPPKDDEAVPEIEAPQSPLIGLPVVDLELPQELWIMNIIAEPQLEHFRKMNGLSWAIDRSCYAMPIFNLKDRNKIPKMGTGYYLMLGLEDKAGYISPPSAPYDMIRSYVADLKDEIHRVAQQMARGVENNAAAVGRSGDSKQADNAATEIVLAAYGMHIRDAVERTMDLVSDGRDEEIDWTISGMTSYSVSDATTLIANIAVVQPLQIPSATAHRELYKRGVLSLMPDLDETKKQQIADEIDAGVSPESLMPAMPLPEIEKQAGADDDEADDDTDDDEEPEEPSDAAYRAPGPP